MILDFEDCILALTGIRVCLSEGQYDDEKKASQLADRIAGHLQFFEGRFRFVTSDGYTLRPERDDAAALLWTDGDLTFHSTNFWPIDDSGDMLEGRFIEAAKEGN